MDMNEKIKRINELYHKSQVQELSAEEKEEQKRLRLEYVASIRGSLRSQLENIDIKEADGSITNLGEQKRKKEEAKKGTLRTKKALIRKNNLEKRDSLSDDEILKKSMEICEKIFATKEYIDAKNIFLYKAYNSEVVTDLIYERAIKDNKKVSYPKCELVNGEPGMDFYYVSDQNQLKEGYKGILEPDIYNYDLEKVSDFNGLVIVPGVAFDKKCNRIGYGKGFYDKFLNGKSDLKTIGLAFEKQMVDTIDVEFEDINIRKVVTELGEYVNE